MSLEREVAELAADLRAIVESQLAAGFVLDAEGDVAPAASAVPDQLEGQPLGLDDIRSAMGDCRRCGLCEARGQIVFGVGNPSADLMIIGEAPGFQEDRSGEPFVGPAGQMLDRMLENVLGLNRSQVYITNIVKCRPPDNRKPLPPEAEMCTAFLKQQVAAIQPKIILVLGSVALKYFVGSDQGITRARGRWFEYDGIPIMPTFHPAYLLRQPGDKRLTFNDLQALRARYQSILEG